MCIGVIFVDSQQRDFISGLCDIFRRIPKKNMTLLVIQLLSDLHLFYSFFIPISTGFYAMPFVVEAVIILKIVLTILKRNYKMCVVCAFLNAAVIILSVYFRLYDSGTIALIIISFMVYGARIKQYLLTERISGLYGFPSFNMLIISRKLNDTPELLESVIDEYENVSGDKFVMNAIKMQRSGKAVKALNAAAVFLIIAGAAAASVGLSISGSEGNACAYDDSLNMRRGLVISGSVDIIYCNSGIGMDKMTNDCYWCRLGDKCITFEVPNCCKEKFALLYNYYAEKEDIKPYNGFVDVYGSSADAVDFVGVVKRESKYDSSVINKAALRRVDAENAVTDMYIQLIDRDANSNMIFWGIIMAAVGFAAYVAAKGIRNSV